jgi:hypothetical protein
MCADTMLEEGQEEQASAGAGAAKLEKEVCTELLSFMQTEVVYALQRLLAADIKILYVGEGNNALSVEPNPLQPNFPGSPHPTKGGIRLTPNITYNW